LYFFYVDELLKINKKSFDCFWKKKGKKDGKKFFLIN